MSSLLIDLRTAETGSILGQFPLKAFFRPKDGLDIWVTPVKWKGKDGILDTSFEVRCDAPNYPVQLAIHCRGVRYPLQVNNIDHVVQTPEISSCTLDDLILEIPALSLVPA
ncbi:MAG: hypothetical protein JWP09_500 [Candidatus Taylorbacteria bacterium]|nr:hypothetical protein [Candidatus Taylorbacteria bacterium]